MNLEIREVEDQQDLKRFVKFPYKLYKNHKYWIPPLIKGEFDTLNKDKNPAFEYCQGRYWLALDGGNVVGRIAGIINHKFIDIWKQKMAGFGWFDFIDDPVVTKGLLSKVETWAKSEGLESMHGPVGFTNFDQQGMLVEGFEELPTVASTYNYDYYPKHVELYGFQKEVDYLEFEVMVPDSIPDKAFRISNIVQKKKKIRLYKAKSRDELIPYAKDIFHIINETYKDLFAFVPMNETQIELYTKKYFPYIQTDFVSLLFDRDDRLVGFQITMPTLSRAMQKAKGRLYPFGFIHLLRALKHPKHMDLYLVGILPEYQNQGLNAIFMTDLNVTLLNHGIISTETNSELEDNQSVQDFWDYYDSRQHKRKRVYIKRFE